MTRQNWADHVWINTRQSLTNASTNLLLPSVFLPDSCCLSFWFFTLHLWTCLLVDSPPLAPKARFARGRAPCRRPARLSQSWSRSKGCAARCQNQRGHPLPTQNSPGWQGALARDHGQKAVLTWADFEPCFEKILRRHNPTNGGYPRMDGLFHGKSHLEMDDDWGYPPFCWKPPHVFLEIRWSR